MVTVFICDEVASDKTKVSKEIGKVLCFIAMEWAAIEEKSKAFVNKTKQERIEWTFNNVLKFMQFQSDRANK